jgi:hypothetical protein
MLYHVVSCCIMLYHVVSCCIMLYHVVSCCIMLYHVVSCCIMLADIVRKCRCTYDSEKGLYCEARNYDKISPIFVELNLQVIPPLNNFWKIQVRGANFQNI